MMKPALGKAYTNSVCRLCTRVIGKRQIVLVDHRAEAPYGDRNYVLHASCVQDVLDEAVKLDGEWGSNSRNERNAQHVAVLRAAIIDTGDMFVEV